MSTTTDVKVMVRCMISTYKFYRHSKCDSWGVGRVLTAGSESILIDFPRAGLKELATCFAEIFLQEVSENEAAVDWHHMGVEVESEHSLASRLEKDLLKGKLPKPYDEPFFYEIEGDVQVPVAGTGRRASSYLKAHHVKAARFGPGYFA